MKYKNTHESIKAQKDKPCSGAQASYLADLYRELLESAITPKSLTAKHSSEWFRYNKFMGDNCKGTLANHFFETYSVEKKLTKNKVSELIHNAKENNKFDKTLAKSWIASNNKFLKEYHKTKKA